MARAQFASKLQGPDHIEASRHSRENALLLRQPASELACFCLINPSRFMIRFFVQHRREKANANALDMVRPSYPCGDHRRTGGFPSNNAGRTLRLAPGLRDPHQHPAPPHSCAEDTKSTISLLQQLAPD